MSDKTKLKDLWPEFASIPNLDEAYDSQFPYATVALAVVALRGELGLTQAQFAEKVGTTQSVVARLESGRHPVRVEMLRRIADACHVSWKAEFGPAQVEPTYASTGDELLDAFNTANTAGDFAKARSVVSAIKVAALTPRRSLALALDAVNHGEFGEALRHADMALASGEMPALSRATAQLVRGRSLLGLRRAADAAEQLKVIQHNALGWLVDATLAEALSDAGSHEEALAASNRALRAGATETLYVAARVEWHADRPWDALEHVTAYRAQRPAEAQGAMLQGAIFGFLGDRTGDTTLFESARRCFEVALPNGGCSALRLHARTLSRLGRPKDALQQVEAILALDDSPKHRETASRTAAEILSDFDGTGEQLLGLVQAVEVMGVCDPAILASHTCMARALQGDVEGAARALGRSPETMPDASPDDQIRFAAAHVARGDAAAALPLLVRARSSLSIPVGMLLLGQCALAAGDHKAASAALKAIAESGGPDGEIAALALRLVGAAEREGARRALLALSIEDRSASRWIQRADAGAAAADTGWEGAHSSGLAVLGAVSGGFVH